MPGGATLRPSTILTLQAGPPITCAIPGHTFQMSMLHCTALGASVHPVLPHILALTDGPLSHAQRVLGP